MLKYFPLYIPTILCVGIAGVLAFYDKSAWLWGSFLAAACFLYPELRINNNTNNITRTEKTITREPK